MNDGSLNLVWCDLEFTHLELERTRILQAAMLVTTPDLEPIAFTPGGSKDEGAAGSSADGIEFLVRITPEEAGMASDWVKANQGELLMRCQNDPAALPPAEVERRMLAYLEATCGGSIADEIHSRPLLAGNSVHKDYYVLERYMPTLVSLLSYRLVDVSCIKELRRRWFPGVAEFDKSAHAQEFLPEIQLQGAEHEALHDIRCSLAELRYYRQRLFRS